MFGIWRYGLGGTIAFALLALGCASVPPGRYVSAVDPASRYHFEFARDRVSGRWVHREFEIRVDTARVLPRLEVASEIGNSFSVQRFTSISVGSAGIFSAIPTVEQGHRVWRGADVAGPDDLRGRVAYGVSVSWPEPGVETRVEPIEIFSLPPLGDAVPEQWSTWSTADTMRAGAMGWWEQVNGQPREPMTASAYPFELRWRLVYAAVPGRIP